MNIEHIVELCWRERENEMCNKQTNYYTHSSQHSTQNGEFI